MGVRTAGRQVESVARDLPAAFDAFLREVGLPISLGPDGLSSADAARVAEVTMAPENKAMRDANIREVLPADARRLAEKLLSAA